MRTQMTLISFVAFLVTACSGDSTLQGSFEQQMQEDGSTNFKVLYVEETETDGLVLFFEDAGAGVQYFQKTERGWSRQTGTACSQNGVSRVGLMGNGYVYCAMLRENMKFESIRVGEIDAHMLQTQDGNTVWFARTSSNDASVNGVNSQGDEIKLN